MRIRLPFAILVAALAVAGLLYALLRHSHREPLIPTPPETIEVAPAETTRVVPPAPPVTPLEPPPAPAAERTEARPESAAAAPATHEPPAAEAPPGEVPSLETEPAAPPVAEAVPETPPPIASPSVEPARETARPPAVALEPPAPLDSTALATPLISARAESLLTLPKPRLPSVGRAAAVGGEHDALGLLAAWRAAPGDTATVRPLRRWRMLEPEQDALLYRLYRRAAARHFVRDELGLRPAYFTASDSLNAAVDARSDSLEAAGGAPGVYVRFAPTGGLRYQPPPVRWLSRSEALKRRTAVDLERRRLQRARLRGSMEVTAWPEESFATYLSRVTRAQSRSVWKDEIKASMKASTVKGGRAGLVKISLPFELPEAVQSIFGEGKPNLSVSGNERISFGGKSQWYPYRPAYEFQRKPSKFPQLEMDQDLTIRLKGTVGDKLDVDVDQSSAATTSLANRIQIHYKGYEDEIVRKIDLGNTSLTLPGTEYVSYGGKHTGLFGINAESQLGDVTLNLIVSKEEGETAEKSTSASSQQQTKQIHDYEYVKDRFFFLDDPTRPAYATPDSGYVVAVDAQSVRVYLDDGDGPTTETFATWQGRAVLDLDRERPGPGAVMAPPDSVDVPYYFQQLEYGTDYSVLVDQRNQSHPILILNRYLDENATVGVTYKDTRRNRWVGTEPGGATVDDTLYVKMIRPAYDLVKTDMNSGGWGPTNRLMLKNVYPLQQSLENWTGEGLPENSILADGFELAIHYKGTVDGVEDPDEIGNVRIVRLVGLDYYQASSTGLELGQDGQIDQVWVDFQNGYLFFPDLRPFAPGDSLVTDLRGRPGDPSTWDQLPREHWNPGIYDTRSCVRDRDLPGTGRPWTSLYYLEVRYRTPVTALSIDAFDIIEGSEVVTAGSRRLMRDRDYRIDYQTGEITLLSEAGVGSDDEIRVTYKHAGGLGLASKTLVGAAAAYRPVDSKLALSTSWLFEQRGSPDRRPRLGSEPTRIAVGEVAGSYGQESMTLTRLLDRLPFLQARKASKVTFEGGLGVSFPNPNTRKNLYIDDFEGVADDIAVRLNRMAWKPTSAPLGVPGADEAARSARRGEVWWYTPYRAAHEGDINPTLDYQEANDYRSVLELQAWPYNGPLEQGGVETCRPEDSWVGIVTALSENNLDLTRARFLDIWVNDFVPWEEFVADTTRRAGSLYLELGRFNEDAIWTRRPIDCATRAIEGGPATPPNRALDTEDANLDGELDLSEATNEDTGLDRARGTDPTDGVHDDFVWDASSETRYESFEELCEVYRGINGTELNGRLDTEDLDGDNSLDQENAYFRFKVDLADSSTVETDVRRDYAGQTTSWTLESSNGWRRIRIPLSEAFLDSTVGDPSWDEVKQLRLWLRDLSGWKRLQIAAIDIRSNRWVAERLQDSLGVTVPPGELLAAGEDFFPGVVNNKENSDVYTAPIEEYRDQSRDNIREREQSLALEVRHFQPGHVGRVYSSFLQDQNYTSYQSLEFYLGSTLLPGSDLEFFLRLCKDANVDSTDYYEYRIRVPEKATPDSRASGWKSVKLRLEDLSDLKSVAGADTLGVWRALPDGGWVTLKGNPYLTKLRRITLGVRHAGGEPVATGSVWIDELRLTEVRQDVDVGYRFQLRTELADLGSLDFSYKHVGADFTTISSGGFSARKEAETSVSLNTSSIPLDRFLPEPLGLRLPFSYQYSRTRKVPKYRTNSDLAVEDHPTDRDVSETASRGYSLSISHARSTNAWMKYTLDAIGLSGSIRANQSATPYGRDSTVARTLALTYAFPFGTWGDVGLYKGWKLHLPPTKFSIGLTRGEQEQTRYRREGGDLNRPFALDYQRTLRSGGLTFATGFRPIKEVTFDFNQSRNLMLRERAGWLGGLNIGRETSRQEELRADYQLRLLRGWFEPRLGWKGNFQGSFNQQGTVSGGGLEYYNDLNNTQTTNASMDLPLARVLSALGRLGGGSSKPEGEGQPPEEGAPPDTSQGAPPLRPPGEEKRDAGAEPRARERNGEGLSLAGLLRIGRTSGTLSFNQRSTYNRVTGEPRLEYQLGLSRDPGVTPLGDFRSSSSQGHQYSIDTDLTVLRLISVSARIQTQVNDSRATSAVTGETTRLLPELDIRWGDLSQPLGIKRFLRTFKANTRFTRRERDRTLGGVLTNREVTSQWSPFFDLDVTLKSGASASLRVDRGSTHTEDRSSLARVTDRNTLRVSLTAKRSLNITRQIRVPLKKTKERITTKLDLSLTAKYDTDRAVSRQSGGNAQVTADTRQIDFTLAGNYQFSKTVSGRAALNLGENGNNKNRTNTARYVGLNLSASFSF